MPCPGERVKLKCGPSIRIPIRVEKAELVEVRSATRHVSLFNSPHVMSLPTNSRQLLPRARLLSRLPGQDATRRYDNPPAIGGNLNL